MSGIVVQSFKDFRNADPRPSRWAPVSKREPSGSAAGVFIRAISLLSTLTVIGCHFDSATADKKKVHPLPPKPTTAPTPIETWNTKPLVVPAQPDVPIRQGTSPLVYLVESPATIRVMDLTSKQELLQMDVPGQTVIGVSDQTGVSVAGDIVKPGPLSEGHEYGIFLVNDQQNYIRTGTISPGVPNKKPSH